MLWGAEFQAAAQNGSSRAGVAEVRSSVAGTVSPRARASIDLGLAANDRVLPRITLRFKMSDAQGAELDRLIVDQQNPESPRYRRWLTPEQYAERFGLNEQKAAEVSAWLSKQGFKVAKVARSRTYIAFSGSAAEVHTAFGVALHRVSLNGEEHVANLQDPTLPVEIAAITGAITGLDDFRLKPNLRAHREPAPAYTSALSGNHYVAPGDFYTIYDLNPANAGAGVTIAVAGQTDISQTDVAAFRSAGGLPTNMPIVRLFGADPGISAADIDEAQLDVEWAGAVAPAATILYVNSTDVIAGSLTEAIDNDVAPIVSLSYGDCESGFGTANIAIYNQMLRQANAQGQTVVGATGDSGATDCDYGSARASAGLAIDFPASSPYVTSVGGTMFSEGGGTYWNAGNGSYAGSALSYIPETAWNETAALGALAASGGGASATFIKPGFQVGSGVPNDFSRDIPDVALNAGSSHDGYLFCSQGSCTNGFRDGANVLDVAGGTPVAASAFAGILALVEQKTTTSLGNANPVLYGLADSAYAALVYRDTTAGNNNSPCVMGSIDCLNGGQIGFSAAPGYDLATGWGSVDVNQLVADWLLVKPTGLGSGPGTNVSVTTLSAPTGSVPAGSSVALQASVGPGGTVRATLPTGAVQFLVDNVPNGGPVTLTGGSAGYMLSTLGLATGAHTLTAAYLGDSNYAGSKGALTLTLTVSTAGDFTLTPATSSIAVVSGGTSPGVAFTVTAVNGFAANVTFSATSSVAGLGATYSFNIDPVAVSPAASGSTVLTMLAYVAAENTGRGFLRRSHEAQTTSNDGRRRLAGSAVSLGMLLLVLIPRRRRMLPWLAMGLISSGLVAFAGCAKPSASTPTSGVIDTPAGTYTIIVTATGLNSAGTTVTHNAAITFMVE
jgi:subtilase family serine protease